MTEKTNEATVKGRECKHVIYCPSRYKNKTDLLFVKEKIHYDDGTIEPSVSMVQDYERNFWVTKKGHQNHREKKEWESESRLQKFTTTQARLNESIAKGMGQPYLQDKSFKLIARSPYLYGCDITTPVLLKRQYMDKWPECHGESSEALVAVLDIESDVVHGTEEVLSISLTSKDKNFLCWSRSFMGREDRDGSVSEEIQRKFQTHLSDLIEKRGITLETLECETPAQMVIETIQRAHQWQPDFIAVWNMDFDVPKLIDALKKEQYNPAEVFSDPRVPHEFRFCKYIQGKDKRITQDGKVTPLHPADRWHTLETPAGFYFIDAMCTYKQLRAVDANEASYSLDYILNKHLGSGKLKFDVATEHTGLAWHQQMQKHHKIEYLIYNLYDCISVEMLDEKTGDLSKAIGIQVEHSEYSKFPSQPRRTCDDLHFFCLRNKNKVIGTTSDQMADELDKHILSMRGWIVTLASYLVADNGLQVLEELPNLHTLIHTMVADMDLEATYPTVEWVLNMSKETTYRELCKIRGVSEDVQRRASINLTGGTTNAVEICTGIYKMPSFDKLLKEFKKQM